MSPTTTIKWTLTVLTLLALLTTPGAILGLTDEAPEPGSAAVQPVSVVSQFAGSAPTRCVFASRGLQLCSWPLEGRLIGAEDPGDVALALNLICELGIEGESNLEPACEVHAVGPLSAQLPSVSAGSPARPDARVLDRIADAATTTEISRALGAIPELCRTGSGVQRCEWDLPSNGRAADTAKLRCELALDGSPRGADSCRVVEPELGPS